MSVELERVSSSAKRLITQDRNSLDPDEIDLVILGRCRRVNLAGEGVDDGYEGDYDGIAFKVENVEVMVRAKTGMMVLWAKKGWRGSGRGRTWRGPLAIWI